MIIRIGKTLDRKFQNIHICNRPVPDFSDNELKKKKQFGNDVIN